jgi:hypothetical protein
MIANDTQGMTNKSFGYAIPSPLGNVTTFLFKHKILCVTVSSNLLSFFIKRFGFEYINT